MHGVRITVVCQDLHPYVGGGIAPTTAAIAGALSEFGEVTFITPERHRAAYEADGRRGLEGAPDVRVRFAGGRFDGFSCEQHAWSAHALEALREDDPPDLVHFPDYLGEAYATLLARRAGDPLLRDALIAVRTHTTDEMVAVLNGHLPDDGESRARHAMERFCLRHADRLLWPGGDILATYQRFYGRRALAPPLEMPGGFLREGEAEEPGRRDGPLRLLFLGRLERRKGVDDLVQAMRALDGGDWRLTLLGSDTPTAPGGMSMRERVETLAGGDERIRLADPVARADVGAAIADHDAVVVPSLWECWPNVVREALRHSRPVVATAVGGHVALVRPGVSGWLARGTGPAALREVLERVVREPDRLRELAASGRPRRLLDAYYDPARVRAAYAALVNGQPARRRVGPGRAAAPAVRRPGVDGDAEARRINRRMRWTAAPVGAPS